MPQAGAVSSASDLSVGGQDEEEEPLDVLDLPQLYTKPTYTTLLATLAELSSQPLSWDATPCASGTSTPLRRKRKVKSEGVPRYLTSIIASPLAWIEDDEEKERVWEVASQRLSERSGRTGMGAIDRTFAIPLSTTVDNGVDGACDALAMSVKDYNDEALQIRLHEPALTSDNLGLKTWASSYLLAKRLATLRQSLPRLAEGDHILELGAGTGLVGMAAAAILKADVFLTDLPDIVPNLERNARTNAVSIADHSGGIVHTAVLDWSEPGTFSPSIHDAPRPAQSFPLILAADPIYSPDHPRLLVQAIAQHLRHDVDARVVVEMPVRTAYVPERDDFRQRMKEMGLGIVNNEEGEEVGYDDWGRGEDEAVGSEVRCWWSVWGWR